MPRFQGFDREIRDIEGFNFNARYFDRLFLSGLGEDAWCEEISFVRKTITDELIQRAIQRMPADISFLSGEELIQIMMSRRDRLEKDALAYYRFLAEAVDLPASDKREFFELIYRDDKSVTVTVYKLKKDSSRGGKLYERTFLPQVTKEVRLYGREGADVFSVVGSQTSPIKVRMIGGGDADFFQVDTAFNNKKKLFIYWDTRNSSLLPTQGMYWNTALAAMKQLNSQKKEYAQLSTAFSFYISPTSEFTIANRIGGGTTLGDPSFFQLLYLGGNTSLRGFRNFRFAGESMVYHNLELRLRLFDFTSYLFPGSMGFIAFNDLGRVWAKGESSKKWHDGFGGGLYLIPAKLILLQGIIGISEEDVLPYLSVGVRF